MFSQATWREVLMRILVLLQRKTLIEKKSLIKMLKKALFDCAINKKEIAVLTEDGAFVIFRPHPGGFDSSRVPTPWNLPSKAYIHIHILFTWSLIQ